MKKRKFLILIAAVVLLQTPALSAKAAVSVRSSRMHALLKRQKLERKELKQQQRAAENLMKQHPESREAHNRFEHNLKMQRQLLRNRQKTERSRLKGIRKSANHRSTTPPY